MNFPDWLRNPASSYDFTTWLRRFLEDNSNTPVVKASKGEGLPVPPWSVDYTTGEVVGTTYPAAGDYPVPLTLQVNTPAVDGGNTYPDGMLFINQQVRNGWTIVGGHIEIDAGTGATADGLPINVNSGATGSLTGVPVTVQGGAGSTVAAVEGFGVGGATSTVVGVDGRATTGTGGAAVGLYGKGTGGVSPLAAHLDGDVKIEGDIVRSLNITLAATYSFTIYDHLGSPIFQVNEDGSYTFDGGSP